MTPEKFNQIVEETREAFKRPRPKEVGEAFAELDRRDTASIRASLRHLYLQSLEVLANQDPKHPV